MPLRLSTCYCARVSWHRNALLVDPARGVLDAELEAHDAQMLFVADGSVFPSSLGVNPQLTIMALARRAARHVHARLSGRPRAG